MLICSYQGLVPVNDGLDHDQHPDDEDLDQDSLARVNMCGDNTTPSSAHSIPCDF